MLDLCMLEQHCDERMTTTWRSLATPLPVSDEMGLEGLFERNHVGRGPLDALEKRARSSEDSLQGKEGILRPFSFLLGTTGGTDGVSRVSSRGRWQSVCDLRSLLQELIKLWRETNWFVTDMESWGFTDVTVWISTNEWKLHSGTEINCDPSIPSLVTPSSAASPFYKRGKKVIRQCTHIWQGWSLWSRLSFKRHR